MLVDMRNAPMDRLGWMTFYQRQFNRTGSEQAATLAMWLHFLILFEVGE
jgi:hypothetical protein